MYRRRNNDKRTVPVVTYCYQNSKEMRVDRKGLVYIRVLGPHLTGDTSARRPAASSIKLHMQDNSGVTGEHHHSQGPEQGVSPKPSVKEDLFSSFTLWSCHIFFVVYRILSNYISIFRCVRNQVMISFHLKVATYSLLKLIKQLGV